MPRAMLVPAILVLAACAAEPPVPATNSATTAPISASPLEMRRPPKK